MALAYEIKEFLFFGKTAFSAAFRCVLDLSGLGKAYN
jgi:hypothetical protein